MNYKRVLCFFGLAHLISSSIIFNILYLMAFFGKKNIACMHIDLFGEKVWEGGLIFLGMMLSLMATFYIIKNAENIVTK